MEMDLLWRTLHNKLKIQPRCRRNCMLKTPVLSCIRRMYVRLPNVSVETGGLSSAVILAVNPHPNTTYKAMFKPSVAAEILVYCDSWVLFGS